MITFQNKKHNLGRLFSFLFILFFGASALGAQGIDDNSIKIKRVFIVDGYLQLDLPEPVNLKEKMWSRVGKYFEKYPTIDEFNQQEPSAKCPTLYKECYLDIGLEVPKNILQHHYYYVFSGGIKELEPASLNGKLKFLIRGEYNKYWLSTPQLLGDLRFKMDDEIRDGGFMIVSAVPLKVEIKDISSHVSFKKERLSYTVSENKVLLGKPYEITASMWVRKSFKVKFADKSYLFIVWGGFKSPCMNYTELYKVQDNSLEEIVWSLYNCDI
jgi:hypothetical protein